MTKSRNIKGQAVLIVLLSLSVVLIIVLYILSRSITDISLSSKDGDAMRAFSAAEAGVERALIIGDSAGSVGNAYFDASVSDFGQGETAVIYPNSLKSGEIATFWFTRPDEVGFTGDSIKLCWGDPNTPIDETVEQIPALEVAIYYDNNVARVTLDPNLARASSENNFDNPSTDGCTINGENFKFYSTIAFSDLNIDPSTEGTLQFASVRFLYNTTIGHKVAIDVSSTDSVLPSQGKKIDSSGSSLEANRRIEMYQLHPVTPPVFENSIFSANGVVK